MKMQSSQVQSPFKTLIIGNGRAATHIAHYFTLLNIPFRQWSRSKGDDLNSYLIGIDRVLLLISDDQIIPFLNQYPQLRQKCVVHFSGALVIDGIYGAHPLISFSKTLFDLAFYQAIPFAVDQNAPAFSELLPGLSNPNYRIDEAKKSFYHALCVLSGNFTTILWQKLFSELESLGLPQDFGLPYLQCISQNLQQNPKVALTGPLARGDMQTIQRNLAALQDDPYAKVYRAFVEVFSEKVNEH